MTLGSKLYSMGTRLTPKFLNFKEVYIEPIQTPRAINVEDWTIYKGFYQSDWYLKNTPKPLKIEIKQKFKNKFRKEFGELFEKNKTIVVHIRRTDYLKYGKRDISLPMDYFRDRLDQIEDIETFKVIFVSDDMDHVKSFFPARPNFIFSSNDEITDFQIIMNADIAIISNSTFSWWAAYLSEKKNIVYAPKNWLGFRIGKEHPKMIMTDRFIWCDL